MGTERPAGNSVGLGNKRTESRCDCAFLSALLLTLLRVIFPTLDWRSRAKAPVELCEVKKPRARGATMYECQFSGLWTERPGKGRQRRTPRMRATKRGDRHCVEENRKRLRRRGGAIKRLATPWEGVMARGMWMKG